ncbi:MAG: cob(I)yrinic acid a,c-diamide adenosyltransferase [Alphaproteobacteria bacterium]|nr:cob(I)yrinic acid a,c-diamide adenosyltransferase [Alphaproteobacteria bacterium]MBN2779717.1 cob(I)yrinic acid a,c-diamide adenosyltransferase [Alphaproteobacteria bacterium]
MNLRLSAIKDVFKLITTRSGDKGMSSLYSGERRSKDDVAFECLGDADEFTCSLGVVRALIQEKFKEDIHTIQKRLLAFSAQVATKSTSPLLMKTIELISQEDVDWIEEKQLALLEKVEIKPVFVCPGETLLPAQVDVARTVCRRVERTLTRFLHTPEDHDGEEVFRHDLTHCQAYINRLSDYLFSLARYIEQNN